jgi:hypothetical protein
VLDRYSAWLVEQGKKEGWRVIDTHTAMAHALAAARKSQPDFTYATDGVHANEAGHHVIATEIIKSLGGAFDPDSTAYLEKRKLVRERGRILADAYLTAAGHKRPGMKAGLPLDEANQKAAALDARIRGAAK